MHHKKDGMSRREAMERLLVMVAAAAGLGTVDAKLFAQTVVRASKTNLKFLKLRLSGFDSRVFTSEFGRTTPLVSASKVKISGAAKLATTKARPSTQVIKPGQSIQPGVAGGAMGCQVNFAGAGGMGAGAADCPGFEICGWFSDSGGSGCPSFEQCVNNVCTGQDVGGGGAGACHGVNDCNGQDCGNLQVCGDNECTEQSCPNLQGCDRNVRDVAGLINQFRNDPFIQDLMKQLNTTNVSQLAVQVESMIRNRRTINVLMTPIR
jgi:hypothetical protein